MSTTAAGHDTVPLEFPVRGQRIAAILRTPRVQPTARATGAPGAPGASGVPAIVLTGPNPLADETLNEFNLLGAHLRHKPIGASDLIETVCQLSGRS